MACCRGARPRPPGGDGDRLTFDERIDDTQLADRERSIGGTRIGEGPQLHDLPRERRCEQGLFFPLRRYVGCTLFAVSFLAVGACGDDPAPVTAGPLGGGGSAGSSAGTGGSAGSSAGTGGSAGSIPAVRELGCKNPVALDGGGYEVCANGVLHRREALACPDLREGDVPCAHAAVGDTCPQAACGPLAAPACVQQSGGGAVAQPRCECIGHCLADSDCGPGGICACAGRTGTCVAAGCTSDASCNGGACLQVIPLPASSCVTTVATFACTTPDDICDDDADCGGAPGMACRLDGAVRKCVRLPVACCEGPTCGTRCWDASDCGGAACVEANNSYCSGPSSPGGTPKERRCAEPKGTCTKDADCKDNAKGDACVWNGKIHECGSPPNCAPA